MTLEERSMAAKWQTLLNASFKDILDYYETHATIPNALLYHGVQTEEVVRKVAVTYAIANIALLYDARLFGGFCSAHFSGIPTKDLDIILVKKAERDLFISALPQFMAMVFDVNRTDIVFSELDKSSTYCTSYNFRIVRNGVATEVNVDIARNSPNDSIFPPVSWGRSISYDNYCGFHIRHTKLLRFKMDVSVIQKCLASGSDVLITNTPKELTIKPVDNFLDYYAERIERLLEQGYKLILPAAHVPSFFKKSERIMKLFA